MFESLANAVSGSEWAYALLFGIAALDAIFPFVPSETAVITGGVLAGSNDLELWAVIAAAAAGAFVGDNLCYLIGHHFGRRGTQWLVRGKKGKATLDWASRTLDERGGELIIAARFIPGGRTATTFSAGFTRYPWRRFAFFDSIGAGFWACYAALLGYFGGKTFEHAPWKGLLLALALAFSVAAGIELFRHLRRRRRAAA
jgi:membrane protein DedA with SNARE-associated domain